MSLDPQQVRRVLHWCHQNGHLDGLAYHHGSLRRGILVADGDTTTGSTIGFQLFPSGKVHLSLDSIADRVAEGSGLGRKDLSDLWQKYKDNQRSESKSVARGLIAGTQTKDNAQANPSELYSMIDQHVSLLLGDDEENLPIFLKHCASEFLGVEWAMNLRGKILEQHPNGISTRRSKRARHVSEIEKEILDAITEWWLNIDSHQPATVLLHLAKIPEEHVTKGIAKMALLPYSCHELFSEKLWKFFDYHFQILIDWLSKARIEPAGPSVLAFAGWLTLKTDGNKKCLQLLDTIEADVPSDFVPMVEFLRFVASDPPSLSGTMNFDDLDTTDLFLSACYYPINGRASDSLQKNTDWTLEAIRQQLDEHGYNDFLVQGVQPRIAELAFSKIHSRISRNALEKMTDLNRQFVESRTPLGSPIKELPWADWLDSNGTKFDVKSNLYFSTKTGSEGLRGFKIKRPESGTATYCGIVFYDKSPIQCSWTYVGEFSQKCHQDLRGCGDSQDDRVLPFVFQIPEQLRLSVKIPLEQAKQVASLLVNDQLIRSWAFTTEHHTLRHTCNEACSPQMSDLYDRIFSQVAHFPIEFCLWKSITESTLHWCSCGSPNEVVAMLDQVVAFLRSGLFPVRLARIREETLIERWIRNVLKPIAEHFPAIRCPVCNGNDISLKLNRITAGGAIFGVMDCKNDCLGGGEHVTILTHCHNCNGYPLLIGKNRLCGACHGLICDSNHVGDSPRCGCGACKRGCPASSERMSAMVEGPQNQQYPQT
jgi:hypothetical protein